MADGVSRNSPEGRWILTAATLGSGMAFLDGTVVNIALRQIGSELDASLAELQWVVNAYLLSLAGLILVGGSLGDRFGRRRLFMVGVSAFALASIACAVAQSPLQLVVARFVQGIGGALLTPGSLALIQGSFRANDRARVIGQWSGLSGIAAAVGPLLGGVILDTVGWRWIFWMNVPLAVLTLTICVRHVPESRDPEASTTFDVVGATTGALGLGALTYAMIGVGVLAPTYTLMLGACGVAGLAAFVAIERSRGERALMPLHLFGDRTFSVANAMTFLVYGAFAAMTFFLVLQLQTVAGYDALRAGLSLLPFPILLLLFSSRSGQLAARIGPRWQLTLGPALCGAGVLLLVPVGAGTSYLTGVLPGVMLFGLGLVALVAPLTASVLAAAPDRYAGIASGISNAVSRTGSLLAVAALPALVGLGGADYARPAAFEAGYENALVICAVLLFVGGLVSFVGLRPSTARG